MKYPHPQYTPFDVDNPFSPDVKGQEGGFQNKFLNRAAAYYMYKCFPVSCLGRLLPDSSSPADIGALCSKEMPAAPGSASKIKMMSPELLAILATYIQISPWRDHNFKSQADTAPPLQEYYDAHLAYFNSFKREFCREKIEKCLREFYQAFPNAIKELPKNRRSSTGVAPDLDEGEEEAIDVPDEDQIGRAHV